MVKRLVVGIVVESKVVVDVVVLVVVDVVVVDVVDVVVVVVLVGSLIFCFTRLIHCSDTRT